MRIRLKRRRFGRLMLFSTLFTAFGNLAGKVWAQPGDRLRSLSPSSLPASGAEVTLRVNSIEHSLNLEPRVTLLDALREYLGFTGTKKGCNHGACGACTVLVNGQRINSCLTLAMMNAGKEITTIEGLATGDQLHPMQAAFIKHDGFQCGYYTSGQIVSAVALVQEGHTQTDDEIREWMSGNLCRCGAYSNIVAAIREVAQGGSNASV